MPQIPAKSTTALIGIVTIAFAGAVMSGPASASDEPQVGVAALTQFSFHDVPGRAADISTSTQPNTIMMSVNPILPQSTLIYAYREPVRSEPGIRYGTAYDLPRDFDRVAVDPMGRWVSYVQQGSSGVLIETGINRSRRERSFSLETQGDVHDVVATPEGRFAIVLSNPGERVGLDVVDIERGVVRNSISLNLGGGATSIAVSADGRRVFLATPQSDRGPAVWRVDPFAGTRPAAWQLPNWFDRNLSLAATANGDHLAVGSPTRHQVAVLDARTGRLITVQDLRGVPGPNGTLVETLSVTGGIVASGSQPSLTMLEPDNGFRARGASTIELPFPPLVLNVNGQGSVVYALGSPEGAEIGRRILFIDTGLDLEPSLRANARRSGDRVKVTGSVRDIPAGSTVLIQWRERNSDGEWRAVRPKPRVAADGTFAWRGSIGSGRFDIKVSTWGANDRARVRIN